MEIKRGEGAGGGAQEEEEKEKEKDEEEEEEEGICTSENFFLDGESSSIYIKRFNHRLYM